MGELEPTLDAHARAVAAFASLIRNVPSDAPIPDLAWSAGELGAHVLGGLRDYERAVREGVDVWPDLRDGASANQDQIRRTHERETRVIAERLPAAVAALHEAWQSVDGTVRWSGGLRLPVDVVAGIQLADVLVHGWDLGRASKKRWVIHRKEAALALSAVAHIAPHFVASAAQGFSGVYEIHLRGDGRLTFAFTDGSLSTSLDHARPAECRLWADPAAFLLTSYGRIPVWRAAVTGAIVAMGRKPWLAFRFKSLLVSP